MSLLHYLFIFQSVILELWQQCVLLMPDVLMCHVFFYPVGHKHITSVCVFNKVFFFFQSSVVIYSALAFTWHRGGVAVSCTVTCEAVHIQLSLPLFSCVPDSDQRLLFLTEPAVIFPLLIRDFGATWA